MNITRLLVSPLLIPLSFVCLNTELPAAERLGLTSPYSRISNPAVMKGDK